MKNRRGLGISEIAPLAIAMVFIAVVLGVGSTVLDNVAADQVTGAAGCNATTKAGCGYDYNASISGLQGLDQFSGWLPTIALVIAAAVVISVLAFFRN